MVPSLPEPFDSWEVPEHIAHEFAPRRSKYACCVFVLNEGDRIASQLGKMRPLATDVDLILADGGSSDGSTDPDHLISSGINTLLVKQGPGGLSAQMRMALAFAMRRGYEGVVVIDGNDKDDPSAIPSFLEALEQQYDHVQGSRFIPGGRAINTPLSRHLGLKLLHAPLIGLASGFPYTDTTNGFRAYSRRLLLDPRVAPFRNVFMKYELHYYLAIRAPRLGYHACEVPVTRAYPAMGKVPTKIGKFRGNLMILKTLLRACLNRFDPPTEDQGHDQGPDRPLRIRRRQSRPTSSV
ncbi:hypothetical protein BH23PLA1_BH23PLA1_12700 [soil metagenome]